MPDLITDAVDSSKDIFRERKIRSTAKLTPPSMESRDPHENCADSGERRQDLGNGRYGTFQELASEESARMP